jgi:hypothetical protein
MGFYLKPGLQAAVTAFDPTVEILWNGRIQRWVVAQLGPSLHKVAEELRGCARLGTGEMTHYTPVFVCEWKLQKGHKPGHGIPAEPDLWIVQKLQELTPLKHRTEKEYDQQVKQEEEREAKAYSSQMNDVLDSMCSDLKKYGKRGDDLRSLRHVPIENNPLSKEPTHAG